MLMKPVTSLMTIVKVRRIVPISQVLRFVVLTRTSMKHVILLMINAKARLIATLIHRFVLHTQLKVTLVVALMIYVKVIHTVMNVMT